jgi:L-2,4-diaminobutyrate transaminase
VPDDALIMREETFGPVAAITPFDTEDEALARANDTEYGLVAYLHTQDPRRIYRLTRALQFGMVAVMLRNDQLDQWDRENFFHPSTHLAQHSRAARPQPHRHRRQGRLHRGPRRQPPARRLRRPLLRQRRLWPQEIADAIAAQARELAYYHAYVGHGTEASITLPRWSGPRAREHVQGLFRPLGSDANETNVKLVWYYNNILGRPEKKKIISRWRGYHGSGLMTGSLTGLELFHKKFDLPLAQVLHTEAPYYFRRADLTMSEADFVAHCVAELEA